jgi:hypothetical protein
MVLVYNTDICIAYKDRLGIYKFDNATIFNLYKSYPLGSFERNGKNLRIVMKCPICDEEHVFEYHINDLLKRKMTIGGCELVNKPIFVFGSPAMVLSFIKRNNEINKMIYAML